MKVRTKKGLPLVRSQMSRARGGKAWGCGQGINQQGQNMFGLQAGQLADTYAGGLPTDGFDGQHGRVELMHFGVPPGADYQEGERTAPGEQVFQQFQRLVIGPLQVINKEHQGLLGPSRQGEQALERQVDAGL